MEFKNIALINLIKNTNKLNQALSYLLLKKYDLKSLTKDELNKILSFTLDDIMKCLIENNSQFKIQKKHLQLILKNVNLNKRVEKKQIEPIEDMVSCLENSYLIETLKVAILYKNSEEFFEKKELKKVLIDYISCKYNINEKTIKKLFDLFLKSIKINKKNNDFSFDMINKIEEIYNFILNHCREKKNENFEKKLY